MPEIRVVRASGRPAREQVSGMHLEEAFEGTGLWVGQLRTPGGSAGGWHHHGDHDTYTYLAEGRARFEWGPKGRDTLEINPGDFVHVPARLVHREINPGSTPNLLVLFRTGTGPTVVPVDSP
jgi:uncharacterized RmlC-like cupin family protein